MADINVDTQSAAYQNDASATTTVIITDVDTDEMWADGDTDLVITGSGFTV